MNLNHQRRNYERTDELLSEMRVLLTVLSLADDAAPPRERMDENAQAVPSLIVMLEKKIEEIWQSRAWEWVGLGGLSDRLTDDEVREAAGEFADDVLRKRAENEKSDQEWEATKAALNQRSSASAS